MYSMFSDEYDYLIKVVMVGNTGVGKSSLATRVINDVYTETYISTICMDFWVRTIKNDNKVYKMQIWDTAGQERFRAITPTYYRSAHMTLLCFSLNDKESFDAIEDWIKDIRKHNTETRFILVGTKSDLEEPQVSNEAIQCLQEKLISISSRPTPGSRCPYIETSAKSGKNCEELFVSAARDSVQYGNGCPGNRNHESINQFPSMQERLNAHDKNKKCC